MEFNKMQAMIATIIIIAHLKKIKVKAVINWKKILTVFILANIFLSSLGPTAS